jgi:hypothetical protein
MATLFSYVVDHDLGFAPNPSSRYCTLVHCKFGGNSGRRNIVELAEVGDWIVGSGGSSKESAGHGKLIYLMRVDEKLPFERFLADSRFRGRLDCRDFGSGNIFALVSRRYFYFGENALDLMILPNALVAGLVKRGPGFRRDYPENKLRLMARWFEKTYKLGIHGGPCGAKRVTPQAVRQITYFCTSSSNQ